MLPADLVRARRRGDRLHVSKLRGSDRQEARELAVSLLELARQAVGLSREEVGESLSAVDRQSRHEKLWAGIKKLVLDECDFESALALDAPALRKMVFERASQLRASLETGQSFDRSLVLDEVAREVSATVDAVELGLFGDLKGAQLLQRAPVIDAETLVERYELGQLQGVLLKATRLVARIECAHPDAYRQLFFKLKFRQLLYRLEQNPSGGYVLTIEGPFSLFESVTKYGLQLALIVPALLDCDRGTLVAEVLWGKERRPLTFETEWESSTSGAGEDEADILRSEVVTLKRALERQKSRFSISVSDHLLEIPGVGITIPDLKFEAPGEEPIYLEVLGFWSREAVWKRIEWCQSGSHEKVVFAVSSRLRVKEEALPEGNAASLYVYKGTMSARGILGLVESLSEERD